MDFSGTIVVFRDHIIQVPRCAADALLLPLDPETGVPGANGHRGVWAVTEDVVIYPGDKVTFVCHGDVVAQGIVKEMMEYETFLEWCGGKPCSALNTRAFIWGPVDD